MQLYRNQLVPLFKAEHCSLIDAVSRISLQSPLHYKLQTSQQLGFFSVGLTCVEVHFALPCCSFAVKSSIKVRNKCIKSKTLHVGRARVSGVHFVDHNRWVTVPVYELCCSYLLYMQFNVEGNDLKVILARLHFTNLNKL